MSHHARSPCRDEGLGQEVAHHSELKGKADPFFALPTCLVYEKHRNCLRKCLMGQSPMFSVSVLPIGCNNSMELAPPSSSSIKPLGSRAAAPCRLGGRGGLLISDVGC